MPAQERWNSRDLIADDEAAKQYPIVEIDVGTELVHRSSGTKGRVVAFTRGARLILEDPTGGRHEFRPWDGAFSIRGRAVALRPAPQSDRSRPPSFTASGSIAAPPPTARAAQASRIWVEGIHDAELVECIWGDDLRIEGVVVEPLHGVDDLPERVAAFAPERSRRLGVLLDHLVPGSKETRIAATLRSPHVLVTGHPYVDIWQAIRPDVLGMAEWPEVPPGRPWKEGVVAALGRSDDQGAFWRQALGRVRSYRDVETPLITAVERLIDFVTGG